MEKRGTNIRFCAVCQLSSVLRHFCCICGWKSSCTGCVYTRCTVSHAGTLKFL